jgi:hypothetical protein
MSREIVTALKSSSVTVLWGIADDWLWAAELSKGPSGVNAGALPQRT